MADRRHHIANPSLAQQGLRRIEWAERSMPVLERIRDRFSRVRPLRGMRVAACLHVTTETAALMRTLAAGGADISLCASNPLSTQDDVAAALVHHDGVSVFALRGVNAPGYYAHIEQALGCRPQLVLDDGCDLVSLVHTRRTDVVDGIVAGCEQTTTGVVRLRRMARAGALRFPVIAVNDTDTKHMFDNRYGTGQSTIDAVCRATNTLLAGKTVVVAGYGYCGKGVAARAAGMGANVVITEIDPTKALDATMQGYRVMPMAEAAPLGDVFVTVTGNRDVLRPDHFAVMRDGAILANAGHFDVEVDVRGLADAAIARHPDVRPHTDEYVLPNGRRLLLLGQGRVVNLVAAEGHPAPVMDLSFADQALTVEWLVTTGPELAPGVHGVPDRIDREVARLKLAAMDVRVDTLTGAQEHYLGSWQQEP